MLRRAGPIFAALAVVLAASLSPAVAAADREAVRESVESRFGAEVLRMREATVGGEAVWLVTMMRRGGNDNAAFKVDTIAVDAETGEPLRGRRLDGVGADSLSSARTQMTEKRPAVLRDRPWR